MQPNYFLLSTSSPHNSTDGHAGLAEKCLTRLSAVALLRAAPDGSWLVSLVANRGEDVPRTSGLYLLQTPHLVLSLDPITLDVETDFVVSS